MIPGDLLSAFPHRQFHTLPGLLDSWAALLNSYPNACVPMQGGSLYHFYDGLWYDPAERRTHDLPCESRTRYRLSQENGNTYFKCVSIVLEVNSAETRNSVLEAIVVLLFLYNDFMTTCFLSKWIRHFVPERILERQWLLKILNFHKNKFSYLNLWTCSFKKTLQ